MYEYIYMHVYTIFKLVEFENNSFRSNTSMFSEQDINTWITEHSNTTTINWCANSKSSSNNCTGYICRRVILLIMHAKLWQVKHK